MNQSLTYRKDGHTGIISLVGACSNISAVKRLSDALFDTCAGIIGDESIRVVILTGSPDTQPFLIEAGLNPGAGETETAWPACSLSTPLSKLDQPVIAAIHGDAIGLGLEMALACDIRIAGATSRFGLPHIKSGFIPWDGGTQRLVRLAGTGKAMEMILAGDLIDAREAKRIGLVNRIVPPESLMTVALEMAGKMAAGGPVALKYAKEAIAKGMDLTMSQGLRLEADLYFLLHTTADRTEGIRAFQEKRPPRFEGK